MTFTLVSRERDIHKSASDVKDRPRERNVLRGGSFAGCHRGQRESLQQRLRNRLYGSLCDARDAERDLSLV